MEGMHEMALEYTSIINKNKEEKKEFWNIYEIKKKKDWEGNIHIHDQMIFHHKKYVS